MLGLFYGTSLMLAVLETYLENVVLICSLHVKQAYLVVLTVNVIVVYSDVFLYCFLAACVLWVKSSTNLWLAGPHTKLVQTLIDSVLFLSNVYCQ